MKKLVVLCLSALLVFSLAACGQKSAVQQATGATAEQSRAIENELEDAGIDYETINEATIDMPETTFPVGHKIYSVVDRDGKEYFLVLDEDLQVVALLDGEELAAA